ncbi:hypothetical protein FEM48_Zijuj12G0124600 [Ziziphus jujuba var. spinosa]|uniref:11-oxo-beta-amyrin 30-oxidase-like n=1 Tax=Ziziphus jujuba var. spinosa TaxID=714518 RepID=A0A978UDB8_ZIZJJ|nr:hypothetical protein FEM48_Zijuj12G0124600 [Ziziphus jujuba var. spinosa]
MPSLEQHFEVAMKKEEEYFNSRRSKLNSQLKLYNLFTFQDGGKNQETTSALLVGTMILLSRLPNWQDRAKEEVLVVFGNQKPDFDGLDHLKVPLVAYLERTDDKQSNIGKLSLLAGIKVSLPIILLHHDKKQWGYDADKFKPERFAEGISKAIESQVPFFPFRWGPRICIGQNFCNYKAKLARSLILQNFTFELSPSYAHAPFTIVTLQPQYGAHIILLEL